MEQGRWQSAKFWHPFQDKRTVGIVIQRLLHRVVDTDRVDACHACLHLHLRVVNARLKVEEQRAQPGCAQTPVLPEVVGEKGDDHRAGSEVDISRVQQAPH